MNLELRARLERMSRREQIMFIGGVLIVCIVLTDRLFVSPWWGYLQKIKKETLKLERLVSQQHRLIQRKDSVLTDVNTNRDYLKAGDAAEVEIAEFLREIEMLGDQSNVALHDIKPLPTEVTDLYQEYFLQVHYEASLDAWTKFVHLIESSPSLIVIDRAILSRTEETPGLLKGYVQIRRMVLNDVVELG
jgi:Tfp pilus assembly protein PilO